MKRGSKITYCPDCGAPHLPCSLTREHGIWWLLCRFCGIVEWRARL